jgi:DHA1 family multidrug resistance protein-like MFS transporter
LALGPLLGGYLADAFGYSITFYTAAGLLVLGGVMIMIGVDEDFNPTYTPAITLQSVWTEWKHVLSTQGISIAFLMRFMGQLGQVIINPITPLFILTLMPNSERVNTFTGLLTGAAALTSTLSAVYLSRLGDRIGHQKIILGCSLITALLYFPQSAVTAGWQLLLLQALVGFGIGGILPSISAILARCAQAGQEGAVYGLDHSTTSAARTLAPMLGAAVATLINLRSTFIATGLLYFLVAWVAFRFLPRISANHESNN